MQCLTPLAPYQGPRLHAFTFPTDTAVFAVGDVHGQRHKLEELLDTLADVRTPNMRRVLVFLGDLVDRGPDSLGTLALAARAGHDYGFDHTVLLPGNHELLMRDALAHLVAGGPLHHPTAANWLHNGGAMTLSETGVDWAQHPQQAAQALLDALPTWNGLDFCTALDQAPSHLRVGDALFVHAGVDPKRPLHDTLDLPASAHLEDGVHHRHWAWTRQPFLNWPFGWAEAGRLPKTDTHTPGLLVVHGHTAPAKVGSHWLNSPERLAKGLARVSSLARLNLDAGAAAACLVAGAVLTHDGWRLAAADGHQ